MSIEETTEAACARIHVQWHEFTKTKQAEKLIALYAEDATLETPLVMAILEDKAEGVLRGRAEIKNFFDEGLRRRPNDLLRGYRTSLYFTDGKILTWEYPRETPHGDQIDLIEMIEVETGKIKHHRIYWGWFGFNLLLNNALGKSTEQCARQGGNTLAASVTAPLFEPLEASGR